MPRPGVVGPADRGTWHRVRPSSSSCRGGRGSRSSKPRLEIRRSTVSPAFAWISDEFGLWASRFDSSAVNCERARCRWGGERPRVPVEERAVRHDRVRLDAAVDQTEVERYSLQSLTWMWASFQWFSTSASVRKIAYSRSYLSTSCRCRRTSVPLRGEAAAQRGCRPGADEDHAGHAHVHVLHVLDVAVVHVRARVGGQ